MGNAQLWFGVSLLLWLPVLLISYDLDFLICAASFVAIAACVLPLRDGPLISVLDWRPLVAVGVASYNLYLWHLPVIETIEDGFSSVPSPAVLGLIGVPASIAIALISYRAIEAPFLRLRRRWSPSLRHTGGGSGARRSARISARTMTRRSVTAALRRAMGRRPEPAEKGGAIAIPEQELVSLKEEDRQTIERSLPYTMTGVARLRALVEAVGYCVNAEIPGALAECGVWRGGSVLAMISTLQNLGVEDREIYLYDTFEGMPEPSELDVSELEPPALETWRKAEHTDDRAWSYLFDPSTFNEDAVRELLAGTGYPIERLHFVRGRVEETIPGEAPQELALLRLDTDWYDSTVHEMRHLYPRLATGGVLIVDDFGHWQGSRRAVEEYLAQVERAPLLTPIDYSARLAVKR